MQTGGVIAPDKLMGLMNLEKHIASFLEIMAGNPSDKEKVRQYQDAFGKLQNHLKGLAQRLEQAMQAQQGGNGEQQGGDPKDAAKVQAMIIQAQTKAKIAENSATQRTRQKEEQFQKGEVRKDEQTAAQIARDGVKTRHELMANRMRTIAELSNQAETATPETTE